MHNDGEAAPEERLPVQAGQLNDLPKDLSSQEPIVHNATRDGNVTRGDNETRRANVIKDANVTSAAK